MMSKRVFSNTYANDESLDDKELVIFPEDSDGFVLRDKYSDNQQVNNQVKDTLDITTQTRGESNAKTPLEIALEQIGKNFGPSTEPEKLPAANIVLGKTTNINGMDMRYITLKNTVFVIKHWGDSILLFPDYDLLEQDGNGDSVARHKEFLRRRNVPVYQFKTNSLSDTQSLREEMQKVYELWEFTIKCRDEQPGYNHKVKIILEHNPGALFWSHVRDAKV